MNDIPFWLNDPTILYDKIYILNLWPLENFNKNEKLNSITRLIILLTFIGYLITKNYFILITSFITLIIIVFIHKNFINQVISLYFKWYFAPKRFANPVLLHYFYFIWPS